VPSLTAKDLAVNLVSQLKSLMEDKRDYRDCATMQKIIKNQWSSNKLDPKGSGIESMHFLLFILSLPFAHDALFSGADLGSTIIVLIVETKLLARINLPIVMNEVKRPVAKNRGLKRRFEAVDCDAELLDMYR
jgi:hypothetical protein